MSRYRTIRSLGAGRFGEVWCAEQGGPAGFRRLVALKRPHGDEPATVARLLHEARIGGHLRHEILVATLDVGRDEQGWYLVLDYVEGHSLAAVIEQLAASGGHLPVQVALQLGQQLCAGLAHAHGACDEEGRPLSLVHGDLSPANVLLRPDGVLKIADFGAARSALDEPDRPPPRGTPGFGAPELAQGQCDVRADLYSLGAILQALLARVPEATWPTELAPLLASTLADDRDARPDSAQGLGDALAALRSGLPSLSEALPHFDRTWVTALRTLSAERSQGTPPPLPERPFRGLEPFGAGSATLFFGREDDARRLAERVRKSALVVLTGASGAGKSSLLAAGLPSCLADFAIVQCRLGPDPVASLVRALAPGDAQIAGALEAHPEAASAILATRLTPRTALVVDQAETLITLAERPERRDAAAAIIADLLARGSLRAVLAVRADFLAPLCDLEPLRALAGRSVELLALPSRSQLARALTGPLEPFGVRFESEALVARIVEAVAGRSGALALLQFCADRLWDARDTHRGVLRAADYARMGGVAGALAGYADQVLADFAPAEQEVARRMLVCTLTTEGTQRPTAVADLVNAPWSGGHGTEVLERLVAARLLTRRLDPDLGPVAEPAHEALAAHWRRLDGWVARDAEAQRLLEELGAAAQVWDRRDRDAHLLWRGDLLVQWRRHAGDLADRLSPRDAEYVDAALKHERRRRHGRVAAVLGIMAALLALTVYATRNWREARTAWNMAERARARSEMDALLTRSALLRERGRHGQAVQEARRVLAHDPRSPQAIGALYASIGGRGEQAILTGHTAAVRDGRFSADGRTILTASMDGTARLWDRAGRALAAVDPGDGTLHQALWHPDGQRFATVSSSGVVRVLDLAGHTLFVEGDRHTPLCTVAWDPRGDLLLLTGCGGSARLLDARWQTVARLAGHRAAIFWAQFTPDAEAVITVGNDGDTRIWGRDGALRAVLAAKEDGWMGAMESAEALLVTAWPGTVTLWTATEDSLSGPHPSPVARLRVQGTSRYPVAAWHPDGRRFVAGGPEAAGAARIYDRETHRATLLGHTAPLHAAAWSPQGLLATADEAGGLRLWTEAGTPRAILSGHGQRVWSVAWSPDGRTLLSVSEDGSARLWDASGHAEGLLASHEDVDFCPVSLAGDRVLTLWEDPARPHSVVSLYARSGERLGRWEGEGDARVLALAWRPDGGEAALRRADGVVDRLDAQGGPLPGLSHTAPILTAIYDVEGRLITGDAAGEVLTWTAAGTVERRLKVGVDRVDRLFPAPAGDRVAIGGPKAWVADLSSGELRPVAGATGIHHICWRPDGASLAATSEDGRVHLWRTDEEVQALSPHAWRAMGCAFSPDGTHLATASWDQTAHLQTADGAPLAVLKAHTREVHDVSWSPDGRHLVTTSWDGTARLRDAEGTPLATLDGHGGEVVRASWSGDGQVLVTCARGGKGVRLWPGNPEALLARAHTLVPDAAQPGAVQAENAPAQDARQAAPSAADLPSEED